MKWEDKMPKYNMTIAKAKKYLSSTEYTENKDKSFNIVFKKPVPTSKRGRGITCIEFQDYIVGRELSECNYPYCRVFVKLADGSLLEYKREDRIKDPATSLKVFETIVQDLKRIHWHSWHYNDFTDIS